MDRNIIMLTIDKVITILAMYGMCVSNYSFDPFEEDISSFNPMVEWSLCFGQKNSTFTIYIASLVSFLIVL